MKKEKPPPFCLDFFNSLTTGGGGGELAPPPDPNVKCECIYFSTNMSIWIDLGKIWQIIWAVVDLLTLNVLTFRFIITLTYFGRPRMHHFYHFLSGGACP